MGKGNKEIERRSQNQNGTGTKGIVRLQHGGAETDTFMLYHTKAGCAQILVPEEKHSSWQLVKSRCLENTKQFMCTPAVCHQNQVEKWNVHTIKVRGFGFHD